MTVAEVKHWQRRALAAEAEVKQLRMLRTHDKDMELENIRQAVSAKVALNEIREAAGWALARMEPPHPVNPKTLGEP